MKRFIIGLLAVAALAGAGYANYTDAKADGRAELAMASPVDEHVQLAQVDVPDAGAAPGLAAEPLGIEPVHTDVAVAPPKSAAPCIDRDGDGPEPCVSNPIDEPRAYLDTVASAKRLGWPLLVLVCAFPLLVLAALKVPWLSEGYRALAVSALIAMTAAAANAAFDGGTYKAMLVAAGGAFLMALQGNRTVAQLLKQAKGGG
jgi:hypothetical protein